MSYLYVLKRLAYVCFLDHKYGESEKYFKISNDLTPIVTKNPSNIYSSQRNLLLFYTYCNIDNASNFGEQMIRDIEDTLPVHSKELCFLMGVSSLLLIFIRMYTSSEVISKHLRVCIEIALNWPHGHNWKHIR